MACNNLIGIEIPCEDFNVGGIKSVYLADAEDVTVTGSTNTGTTGTIEYITGIALASGATFVQIAFPKNGATWTEDSTPDLSLGLTEWIQTLVLNIPKRNLVKRNAIQLLAAGQRSLFAIVVDYNDQAWAFGLKKGLNLSNSTGGFGSGAPGEVNGYVITFVGNEPYQAPLVDPTIIAGLL